MKFSTAIFKTFFLSLCIVADVSFAYAQTASILPPAKTTFVDQNGKPLTSGTVDFYVPGTTTRKTTWQDSAETIPNTNPVVLDAAGRALILGDGSYRQIVKDRNGNLIWDQVTSSLGSGGSSGSTIGDGLSVGTILPTSDIVAPVNYQFAYGQALSRSTYSQLFSALTVTTSINCVGGSPIITVSDTSSFSVGTVLESICASGSPTVISKTSGTITLSANSTVTVSTTGVFFPYGNGDALTTFNVPDLRGYVIGGRCNMGGVDCTNLNSTYFSSNTNNTPSGINAKGGNQSSTLITANLPPQTPAGNVTSTVTSLTIAMRSASTSGGDVANSVSQGNSNGTDKGFQNVNVSTPSNVSSTFTGTAFVGQNSTPFSRIQPTLTLNYIIKVTPDINLTSTYGVAAIGGMTGVIACGTNVICAGNTISVNVPSAAVLSFGGMTGNIACGYGLTCINNTVSPLNYYKYGIKCDGVTDDGPAFTAAYADLAGAPLILPAGTCVIATQSYRNTFTTPGILTVPGVKIIGQGAGVTKIDARVPNGYAVAVNPAWAAEHSSMFTAQTQTVNGTLATNTYYMAITVTDNNGNEVNVSPAKSFSITGPTGSIRINLQPIQSGYCYNIYLDTVSTPAHYATVSGLAATCLGGNQSVQATAINAAHTLPTANNAVWQEAQISNLSFTNTTAATNASAVLWFRVGYSTINNVLFTGMSGNGLDMPNWTGDNDGNFVVTVDKSKFDNIAGWCINAAGNTLEFSNFTVSNTVFNLCGTLPTNYGAGWVISSITNANPGVVTTSTTNTLATGDQVYIQSVAGMSLPAGYYRNCNTLSGTAFSLCDLNGNLINTTSLGAYTANSGQVNLEWRPPQMVTTAGSTGGPTLSGAIAYTGLISNWLNNGFTQNKNVDVYFSEAGLSDNATFTANDMENTYGKGLYIASVAGMTWNNGECLATTAVGPTLSCMQFGTGLNKGGAQKVQIGNIKVRSDNGLANGFEQLTGASGLIYQNTVYFTAQPTWQAWSGLNKYVGFLGNPNTAFWAKLDGKTGAACTIKASFNIASCVRNSAGDYTLTFTTPFLDTNYTAVFGGAQVGVAGGVLIPIATNTTTYEFRCTNSTTAAAMDCDIMSVAGQSNPN